MVGMIKDQSDTEGCRLRTFTGNWFFALIFIRIFSIWFFLKDVSTIFISLIDWCHFWILCIFFCLCNKWIRFLHMYYWSMFDYRASKLTHLVALCTLKKFLGSNQEKHVDRDCSYIKRSVAQGLSGETRTLLAPFRYN